MLASKNDEISEDFTESIIVNQACTECEIDGEDSLIFSFQHSKTGVPITNRSFHLKIYPNVFTGYDAITWLQGKLSITREEAREIGQQLMDNKSFSRVTGGKKEFKDGNNFYRLAKHDISERYSPLDVPKNEPFQLGIHGFKGCPFCKRAIDAGLALAGEVGLQKLILESVEHENRSEYAAWLKDKKNVLSKNNPKVAYHTSSPIVFTVNTDHYIGGLDEMLDFLGQISQFKNTKALKKYQVESPVSTFVKGIPTIAKNFKSTLPF